MSEFLVTNKVFPDESSSVEGRLADIIETEDCVVQISEYKLSEHDLAIVVNALRLAHAMHKVINQ